MALTEILRLNNLWEYIYGLFVAKVKAYGYITKSTLGCRILTHTHTVSYTAWMDWEYASKKAVRTFKK